MKLSRIAMGSAVALSLVGGAMFAAPAGAQDCVSISGGDITNDTSIWISADAGTAISDASAGSNNLATTSGGADGTNVASAGNGGVATAAANGGAISTGDINSGGNVGNAVVVGDTNCGAVAPAEGEMAAEAPAAEAAAAEVVALPETGVGGVEFGSLFAVLASAGAAATALGLRRR
ncbi:MAG: hypothetical protein U0031_22650 [Thermomicrobiales bacterium]